MAFPILKHQHQLGFFENNCFDDGFSRLTNLVDFSFVSNRNPDHLRQSTVTSMGLPVPLLSDTLDIIHDSIEIAAFDTESFEPIPLGPPVSSVNPTIQVAQANVEPNFRPLPDHPRLPDSNEFMKLSPTETSLSTWLEPQGDSRKRDLNESSIDGKDVSVQPSPSPKKKMRVVDKAEFPEVQASTIIPDQQVSAPQKNQQPRFRGYQKEQWEERFEELCQFHKTNGHCQVQNTESGSRPLARWVKRQRYQYRLRMEGKPSAMTNERVKALENLGFVWDSHSAAWDERLKELVDFKTAHKHCNVPSNFPDNPSLASWVKCQRRQYKLYREGQPSTMTIERIIELEKINFEWEIRSKGQKRSWYKGY